MSKLLINIRSPDLMENMTIDVAQRGGFVTWNLLQLYCSGAQAFIIAFSMTDRKSLDAIGNFVDAIVKADRNANVPCTTGGDDRGGLQASYRAECAVFLRSGHSFRPGYGAI